MLQGSQKDTSYHANSLWPNSIPERWHRHLHMLHCHQLAFGSTAAPSLQAEGMMLCWPLPAKLLSPASARPCLSWLSSSRQSVSPLHSTIHLGPLQSWHGKRWSGSDPHLWQQAAHFPTAWCLCTLGDWLQLLAWNPHLCKNSAQVSSP